jgi:Zn-dependent oligopeptidase
MKNKTLQLDLVDAYSQNTIWDSLFRLDFNNTDDWRAEFSKLVSFLQTEFDDILAKPASWKKTYLRFKKIVSICKYISDYCGSHPDIYPKRQAAVVSLLGEVQRQFNSFINGCWTNSQLILKFKSLGDTKLTEAKREIYDSWIENFFKDEHDVETKKNYAKLSSKLKDHIYAFHENNDELNNGRRNTIFVPTENLAMLEGIKQDAMDEAAQRAKTANKNGWLFLITESTTYKILRECKDRSFRHRVYKKYHKINQVGDFTFKNGDVLKDILSEKHKIAQLMGKDNYAELVISNYMINTPKDAYLYLDKIEAKLLPTVQKLEKEMKELAKIDKVREMKAWDVTYYFQRLNAKYNLYVNNFEDYFCFEDFLPKILSFFEQKFDLKITKESFNDGDQKDVVCYRVVDNRTERHGFFFVSPYNNPGKWNFSQLDLLKSDTVDGGFILPSIQLIDLMINKGDSKNPRSKMSFFDVYTTIHEFGHAFHSFFEPINDQIAKNLKMSWDLIEMPSQFLEHYIYDYELMKSLSSHFETKEQMTEEFFLQVVKNEQYFDAYHTYCNIQTYKAQLWVYENFKPYSAKNLQKLVEAKLAPKGIIYNIARDDFMTYTDHNLDYGPSGYIYLYSAQLAYQIYKQKPDDLRKVFTQTFNSDKKVDLKAHMEKNFDLNEVDILSFITKGLPIEIYA